ncbi:hypothetical protein [Occallatibacter riparius]|uniref:Uncharacterized protein n=1 Tax=Occallatibacter riparius TaxID=1002689 RepID=A0A9J7BW27_9BACT|nr:hypothetical protein [Occallatibacter riparius]UWZ86721.1 hypothetical protein MOP44_12415 [Occallatibacter riparius]
MSTTITPESAVQRCLDAYNKACAEDDARNDHSPESLARVNRAYRRAMPFLTPATIDAFLACVTHGLVLEIFTTAEAAKLLYATQIAVGSRRTAQQQSKAPQPQPAPTPTPLATKGAEGAVAPPQVAQVPTPLPPGKNGAAGAMAPPQVANDKEKAHVQAMLEQILSGKTIPEAPLAPWKKAPPTPSPFTKSGLALPTAS